MAAEEGRGLVLSPEIWPLFPVGGARLFLGGETVRERDVSGEYSGLRARSPLENASSESEYAFLFIARGQFPSLLSVCA